MSRRRRHKRRRKVEPNAAPKREASASGPLRALTTWLRDIAVRILKWGAERHVETWLRTHSKHVLGAILVLSVVIRAICFLELNRGPCVWQHRWDQTDMHFFDLWARQIAAGDWLTDKSLHPHLGWHRVIASRYLKERPDEDALLSEQRGPDGEPVDPSRVLWDRWYGGKRFHQEPLYPYLIAVTYKIFGADPRWVFAWQLLLGAIGNVLIYLIARRAFGHTTGTLAGLLAVLCGPLLFYEFVLQRASLAVFLGLMLVYVADLAMERMSWRWWLLAGIVLGLGILLSSTFATFAVCLFCILFYKHRRDWKLAGRAAASMVAGVFLCLVPPVARNVAVGAPALSLTSGSALTFLVSNTADYDPSKGFCLSVKYPPAVLMARTDNQFLPTVVETLRTHPGVMSYVRQLWGKFRSTWHWREKPNNANFYYYRLHSRVLRYLPVTFLILAPLGIVGLFLAAPRFISLGPLYALVLKGIAPLVLFYALSRFRVPLMAAVVPFAALALTRLGEWVCKRDWRRSGALAAGCAVLFLWTAQGLPPGLPLIRRADYMAPLRAYYAPEAQRAQEQGDWQRVADLFGEFLRFGPPDVGETGLTESEVQMVTLLGKVHHWRAEALKKSGRASEAAEEERRAAELLRAAGVPK